MAAHRIIVRDQEGDYIPVSWQFSGADGAAMDPSAASLIVYADNGSGTSWPTSGITGSPFTLGKIASKTGWYGARIPKASLPVGRYNFLVEATVDGVSAALAERVDVLEAADFRATGFSTFDPATDQVDVGKVAGTSVSGVADFRATGFSTHDPAAIRTELTTELARIDAAVSSRLAATEYTAPPDVSALATSAEIAALESHGDAAWTTADVSGLSTFDPAISSVDIGSVAGVAVFGVADFRATGFSTHDPAAVVVAMQASAADFHADVSSLATTARIDALESHGDTNWTCDGGGTAGPTAEEIRIEMDANSAKLANLDAAVSSRLSAADYAAPPDVSALATSAEIAALESHGDTNWLSVDVSGLSTHSPADTANAVLSGLLTPHDEIEGSTAQALSRLDTNVSSITVGEVEVSVDASTIHDALDTWNPAQAENPPPLITPPPAAEDCRVFLWFGGVGANDTPSVLDGAALRIVALPSVRHGRFFGGDKSPVLADGLAYWDVVRGARVRVSVPCCGVDDDVDIPPDAATLDLAEFFTIP